MSVEPQTVAIKNATIKNDCRDVAFEALKPAYEWVGGLVPRSITPNQLTLMGLFSAALGSALLVWWPATTACFVAGILIFLYETFDALDGIHARNTGQSSPFGGYLDAVIDSAQAVMVFTAIIVRFDLYAPFFILVFGARMMLACWIHAFTIETSVRVTPTLGSTVENYLLVGTLFAAGLFTERFNVPEIIGAGPGLTQFLTEQKMAQMGVIEGSFIMGAVVVMIVGYGLVSEARRTLK